MSDIKPIETVYNGYRFRSRLEARWAVFFDALGVKYEYEPEGYMLPSGRKYLPDFKVKCYGTRGSNTDKPFDLFVEVKGEMTESDAKRIKEFVYGKAAYQCSEYGKCIQFLSPSSDYIDHVRRWQCKCGLAICRVNEQTPDRFWCRILDRVVPFVSNDNQVENSVLVVSNIPNPETYCANCYDLNNYERMNGIDILPWNYETIDGDYFACYPAVDSGHFYLDGDDSNYQTMDLNVIREAFKKARSARFEYGETPTI